MITVLYGTESGNSEVVADAVTEVLTSQGHEPRAMGMEAIDPAELGGLGRVVVISSTYGEGQLPETAQPFYDALVAARPDLSSLQFFAFGLGDSSYETYSNGIEIMIDMLKKLGARQVGETGRHDAATGHSLSAIAVKWAMDQMTRVVA